MNEVNAEQIARNIAAVRSRIDWAARDSGRNPDEIVLVAVSKTVPVEAIDAAAASGITDLGESRVQEAIRKIDRASRSVRWHLIGHLQSNKAASAVRYFDMIQSLDSLTLAERVSQLAQAQGKTIDGLVEVNSSGEAGKFGFAPDDVVRSAALVAALPGIRLRGIMTVGPLTDDAGRIRGAFERTAGLFAALQRDAGRQIEILSMGMSSDFEEAIRCGTTMVRIGAAIFDARESKT